MSDSTHDCESDIRALGSAFRCFRLGSSACLRSRVARRLRIVRSRIAPRAIEPGAGFREGPICQAAAQGRSGINGFSEEGAVRFLNGKFGVSMEGLYGPNPGGSYLKAWLRAMRVLLEWSECGCICRRMAGGLSRTELPDGLQELLGSFEAASMAAGHSRQTVYTGRPYRPSCAWRLASRGLS